MGMGAAPDSGAGAAVEPGGGTRDGLLDLRVIGARLPGEGLAAEQAPPASWKFSRHAPTGSGTGWTRGWSVSQAWIGALVWLLTVSWMT